ncbi:flagellar hook-associated protein FlgL [Clostridium sp. MSJ-11]|uniref:Flagellar hook-associated protein FlgL n=1 Tax=Clostridium mobile TaxID=2841512 RepID=A0ABS6ED04_9CLOT|nr:flagellar hook-associated protein FlgL [Clostridium mobile]MBU5483076.1 flagellar hook-associated protein FlgL [Clostridium mobile]
MRVTNKMLATNFLSDMRTNMSNLRILQMQLSSGKLIRRPSDDPLRASRAMQLHTDINTNKQYNSNIKDTKNWLDQTDTSLNQLGNQIKRVRDLLMSAGNGSYSIDERKKVKDEVNEIIGQFAQTLNGNFDGKYIFSGTRVSAKPVGIIKGPATTDVQSVAAEDGKIPEEGKVVGKFTGTENKDYEITVGKIDTSTNKVIELSVKINGEESVILANGDGSFDLGDGMKFSIEDGEGNVPKNKYTFSAIADGNTKLVYKGREGETLQEPTTAKISKAEEWKGKEITFDYKGEKVSITLDDDIKTSKELVKNINDKLKGTALEGKLSVEMIESGDETNIKFTNLDDKNPITLSGTSDIEDLKDLKGKDVSGNELDLINEKLVTEISQGVRVEYNVTASEILTFTDSKGVNRDVRDIFENIIRHLDDENGVKKLTGEDLEAIDEIANNILKVRSQVGAKQNTMDGAKERNTEENFNITEILSETEDVNVTEKIMEYATAQMVYMASLQTSARVLQPTLMDYIR